MGYIMCLLLVVVMVTGCCNQLIYIADNAAIGEVVSRYPV